MAKILKGDEISRKIEEREKKEVSELLARGVIPHLAIILVGNDEASRIYVSKKKEKGESIGIKVSIFEYAKNIKTDSILEKIKELNLDRDIHGIIVQFPLPKSINKEKVVESISPAKDVDGIHPLNWGKLAYTAAEIIPCAAAAVMEMLAYYKIPLKGKEVVIVGKSEIVGKPLGILLMNEDATLTIAHKKTKNLKDYTSTADVIISGAGVSGLIKKDMIKKGSVLIDIGITRVEGKVKGDIDFNNVLDTADAITPVPGGVGPVTVSMLLRNVVSFAKKANL